MSNKEQLNNQVSIGIQAKQLLDNPLLSSIFLSKKNQSCELFMNTNRNEDKKRAELWQDVQGVISLEQELQQLVLNGNIAKEQLNHENGEHASSPHSPFNRD